MEGGINICTCGVRLYRSCWCLRYPAISYSWMTNQCSIGRLLDMNQTCSKPTSRSWLCGKEGEWHIVALATKTSLTVAKVWLDFYFNTIFNSDGKCDEMFFPISSPDALTYVSIMPQWHNLIKCCEILPVQCSVRIPPCYTWRVCPTPDEDSWK